MQRAVNTPRGLSGNVSLPIKLVIHDAVYNGNSMLFQLPCPGSIDIGNWEIDMSLSARNTSSRERPT